MGKTKRAGRKSIHTRPLVNDLRIIAAKERAGESDFDERT
jgi:hypothetical protein